MHLIDIDSQEVLKETLCVHTKEYGNLDVLSLETLRSLSPIDPKDLIPHGKWEWLAGIACCSGCGKPANGDPYDGVLYITDYCPNCGAKMDKK